MAASASSDSVIAGGGATLILFFVVTCRANTPAAPESEVKSLAHLNSTVEKLRTVHNDDRASCNAN